MNLRKIFLLMLIPSFFIGCMSDLPIGIPLSSFDISNAKKAKYFINEYIPSQRKFNINDTVYNILEVWSEKAWKFKNKDREEEELGFQHFIVKFDKSDVAPIPYLKSDYSNNKLSYTNEKMYFEMSDAETKADTIKLYFVIKQDTIQVLFVKKNK